MQARNYLHLDIPLPLPSNFFLNTLTQTHTYPPKCVRAQINCTCSIFSDRLDYALHVYFIRQLYTQRIIFYDYFPCVHCKTGRVELTGTNRYNTAALNGSSSLKLYNPCFEDLIQQAHLTRSVKCACVVLL